MAISYEFGRDAYDQLCEYEKPSMNEIIEQWITYYSQSIQDDYATFSSMTESDYANERQQVLDNENGFDDTLVLGRLCDEFETFYYILELAKADNFETMKNEFDEFLYDEWEKYIQD
jgi:hypothetical protein